jgi:L-2-hydroxyglutarate oxidase
MKQSETYDFAIIGGGIIGVAIGIALLERFPTKKIAIFEKEKTPGVHASGRNSGVIHAGFYYSPDSLKAKFCKDGNRELSKYCKENKVPFKNIGKVVVTKDQLEVDRLKVLFERGIQNGIDIDIYPSSKIKKFEPLANTYGNFIWSPTTSIADPKILISSLMDKYKAMGGYVFFESKSKLCSNNLAVSLYINGKEVKTERIVNAAGGFAANLARDVGVGTEYVCLPFLGSYRKSDASNNKLQRLVYPVPNPDNPFLGVHTTNTIRNDLKIGPTAFPVIGKEQYRILNGFNSIEVIDFVRATWALLNSKTTNFFELANSELLKQFKGHLISSASYLSPEVNIDKTWSRYPAGIRSQIVNVKTKQLEMDYIVTNKENVTHILNAVSPGWTSSLPFGRWVVDKMTNFS